MQTLLASWQFWAIGAAFFAALTAIFAKLGVVTRTGAVAEARRRGHLR